jgi:hypothetical protein
MCNPFEEIVKTVDRAWTGTRDAVSNTLNGVGKVVDNVVKNPLPVVTMVAATWALGPAGFAVTSSAAGAAALAAGSIAASQGKNVGQIAQSALLAYGGSNFANYTGAGDLTASIGNSIGGTTGAAAASGLNNALFNSTVALLGGKDVGQAFGAGFLGGAAGSVAGSAMNSEVGQSFFGNVKESFGLDDSQMKYIQGASQAMGTAAISGQDPQLALTNYVAQNIANIGKTEIGKQFTSAKEAFITSKLDLEQEAKNQEQIINTRNALYGEAKPVLDQYTALRSQYDDIVNKLNADNDSIQKNRGGYDAAMAAYESDRSNETIDRVNAEAEKLKPYTDSFDRNKTTYDQLEIQLKDLNTKLTDYSLRLNGFDSQIQASNDKITQLSDTFADTAAELEKTSKQVGTSLVETATSDIELAEITRQEEAAREAARQEEERQNTLRIEEERQAEEARQEAARQAEEARAQAGAAKQAEEERRKTAPPNTYGLSTQPLLPGTPRPQVTGNFRPVGANEFWTPPVEVPGEDGGTLTVNPETGAVDVQEPATDSQPPGAVYDIDDTDIGSEIGSETVTTSPGEEPLADLTKSGVMMPDGSYKTWAELDELAGVPPGTIYTDGGTTITEQELLDIINRTYTPRGTTPKPTAPKPTTPAPKPTTPTTQPTTQPVTQPAQQTNPLGMLALLDILGQPQQQPQAPQPVQGADIRLMENIFGTDFTTPRPEGAKKYSSGGEIEALLHLLRS